MLRAVPILAGRITGVDRETRTIRLGLYTFNVPPDLWLDLLEIGESVSIIYEEREAILLARGLRRLY